MCQREYGCASENLGVPVGIWMCQWEYWFASGNIGGPERIGLGNGS